MHYQIVPDNAAERLALWLGLAPIAAIDVLIPLLQVRSIMAAVKLGVFEQLKSGSRNAAELAVACQLDPECLELLLRVLASSRYLRYRGSRYALTPLSRKTLLHGSRSELCGYVELNYEQWHWIEGLEDALQSGGGVDLHDHLPAGSATWSAYQRAMLELARPVANLLAKRVPVPKGARHLLDLGGGHGLLGAAICRAHPPLTSTVIDLGPALPEARRLAVAENIAELVTHREGDLASCELGSEIDVALLSNILHHFAPGARQGLLARTFEALRPGGTLAIWETEGRPSGSPELARDAISLYFRVTSSARSLSGAELQAELELAGFRSIELHRLLQAPGRILLHARKSD
jgi:hypothetical protein